MKAAPGLTSEMFSTSYAQQWCALRIVHDRIDNAIEAALQAEHELSVREFTVLQMLREQDGELIDHFQMKDVAAAVCLSQSATTRLIDRLEKRGLLTRYICPTDRRGVYTDVTKDGLELLQQAIPTNNRALVESLDQIAEDPSLAPFADLVRPPA